MLTCKEVVNSISKNEKQTWLKRIEVRMHLMMCDKCGNYAKQLQLLKIGIKNLFNSKKKLPSSVEIKNIENNIIQKMKK